MSLFDRLRRRHVPAPVMHAPLRAAEWDGHALELRFDAAAAAAPVLDLDGAFFAPLDVDADGVARFRFAFSPSGAETIEVMPRNGRGGEALAAAPLPLRLGAAGFAATPLPALLPSAGAAGVLPFGVDVAAIEVAIVVPVYGAPDLVERCLDSVLAHTVGKARLIVIDDASPQAEIAPLLARYAGLPWVEVLRNERNLGFTATANRGIAAAGRADVVLLNADAEVGPNWLAGLRRAAHAGEDVATATAVSDNAGAFSVPELEQANDWPAGWSFDTAARALWQDAGLAHPELPTGNGFCLYIRRAVLDAVGVLDEAAFPQGYGEENDFCQRASASGWRHRIAGNVLVRHARSASFGEERRRRLGEAGMAVLRERWPDYEADVGRTLFSFERRVLDWRVRRRYMLPPPLPRLLWVGNTPPPSLPDARVWNLRASGERNELVDERGRVVAANTWVAHDPEPSYHAMWQWLQLHAFDGLLVAARKGSDSAAEILCRLLDLPILPLRDGPATAADLLARERRFDPAAR